MSEDAPVASFQEIRDLLPSLPGADEGAAQAARDRQALLTKPAGALGRLEDLAVWLSAWQGRHPPSLERPYVAVFAGNHGVAAQGVSAYPPDVTRQMMENFIEGGAAVNQLTALVDGDLRVYELALDQPTGDFTEQPAMSEEDCAKAMAYGMMAVETGIDVLALGEMGIGNTTAAAALCAGLFGGEAADWVRRGTGIDDTTLQRKVRVVDLALHRHRAALDDPLEVLRCLGGLELAAIAGAVLAARMAGTPGAARRLRLHRGSGPSSTGWTNSLLDHCQVAHLSVEPGPPASAGSHRQAAVARSRHAPRAEASGAALGDQHPEGGPFACHNGMATFEDAGVSGTCLSDSPAGGGFQRRALPARHPPFHPGSPVRTQFDAAGVFQAFDDHGRPGARAIAFLPVFENVPASAAKSPRGTFRRCPRVSKRPMSFSTRVPW